MNFILEEMINKGITMYNPVHNTHISAFYLKNYTGKKQYKIRP